MSDLVDRLKVKDLTDEEMSAYVTFLTFLKLYQKVEPGNAFVNNLISKLETWV